MHHVIRAILANFFAVSCGPPVGNWFLKITYSARALARACYAPCGKQQGNWFISPRGATVRKSQA
jgi:hypothetical protein